MLVKENVNESTGHWYLPNGNTAYTTIAKSTGRERPTTLADARKLGLLPSVTTIINTIQKTGLDTWKQQQVLLAALTLPRLPDEPESDWLTRVMQDSKATGKEAAERGTAIHSVLEAFYEGIYIPELPPYVRAVESVINEHFGPQLWVSEKSFAKGGYGGKCDLIAKNCVIDFKTTEKDLDKLDYYFDHQMQLSAYRQGFEMPTARCAIVYVNALQNKAKLVEIPEDDLRIGWDCFTHLLAFYRAKNKL